MPKKLLAPTLTSKPFLKPFLLSILSLLSLLPFLLGLLLLSTLFLLILFLVFPKSLLFLLNLTPFLLPSTRHHILRLFTTLRSTLLRTNPLNHKNYICLSPNNIPHPRYYSEKLALRSILKTTIKNTFRTLQNVNINLQKSISKIQSTDSIWLEIPYQLGFVGTMGSEEIFNLNLVRDLSERYKGYSFAVEAFFGDMVVNGANPYSLNKMQIATDGVQSIYQQILFQSIKHDSLNRTLLNKYDFGFRLSNLQQQIQSGREAYCMNLQLLRDIHISQPHVFEIPNSKTQKTKIYQQFPYAVFLKGMDMESGRYGWICVAAVFRYTVPSIRFVAISPFINGHLDVWKYVRGHIASAHLNDFEVRTHVGFMHIASTLYTVPIFNYRPNSNPQPYLLFLKYSLHPFLNSLQPTSCDYLSAFTHPQHPSFSLGISPSKILQITTHLTTHLDLSQFNPETLISQKGLELLNIQGNVVYYDKMYYDILFALVSGIYDECNMERYSKELLREVNKTIREQVSTERKEITDVKKMITSLVWGWTVYHWHSFVNQSLSLYYKLRPMLLCQPIPTFQSQWPTLSQPTFYPTLPLLTNVSVYYKTTTSCDPNNCLMDVLSRMSLEASREKLAGISELFENTVRSFQNAMVEIAQVNRKREQEQLPKFCWLDGKRMQASANV